jgi:dephospho-CoA kinase
MIVLGLTGSIAMGKSTTAAMFRHLGVPVHDADRTVHQLLAAGGAAVQPIDEAFPGSVQAGGVDRPALGARVFGDKAALRRLEAILHPLVSVARQAFLARQHRRGRSLVVVDIPLLFETGAERTCDAVAVVSAPAFLQRQRLLLRPGMSEARIAAILARQLPDAEKRRRADYVIPTGLGRAVAFQAVRRIVADLGRPSVGR